MSDLSTYRPYSGPMCYVASGEISSGNDSYVRVSDYRALEQKYRDLSRERLEYGRTERNKALAEAALLIRNNSVGQYGDVAAVFVGWIEGMIEP